MENWRRTTRPDVLRDCECGSEDVVFKADGIVHEYKCADCDENLGNLMIAHET